MKNKLPRGAVKRAALHVLRDEKLNFRGLLTLIKLLSSEARERIYRKMKTDVVNTLEREHAAVSPTVSPDVD